MLEASLAGQPGIDSETLLPHPPPQKVRNTLPKPHYREDSECVPPNLGHLWEAAGYRFYFKELYSKASAAKVSPEVCGRRGKGQPSCVTRDFGWVTQL